MATAPYSRMAGNAVTPKDPARRRTLGLAAEVERAAAGYEGDTRNLQGTHAGGRGSRLGLTLAKPGGCEAMRLAVVRNVMAGAPRSRD
ncbi:hypothetical protein IMZ48_32030 [Candidatus Bathyarchaeota archaeon]|nr:hypothetical protein [Candidatus Bathyarchaeota archaeon]